ncbi:MAG: sigma-54-dependent Fis family transcriptional regulator [Sandaracinus sp.]
MASSVERERDFYRQLLRLGMHDDPASLLEASLALVVDLTRADEAYVELTDDEDGEPRTWSVSSSRDPERVAQIRSIVSRGIIAEALATGRSVVTPAAFEDPRFEEMESVRAHRIASVLCAPIGRETPSGVVYVRGSDGFDPAQREAIELLAQSLEALAARSIRRAREDERPKRASALAAVVGRSAALTQLLDRLTLAAPLDVTLLLTGPSGTGKTMLAQAAHRLSGRPGAFVELNCAAIPDGLLESELFGSVEGAHSTATRRAPGKIEAAERGTLLLDEVGDLSASAQAKLLQVLESRTYYPLGSATPRQADVRLVAATHVDLGQAVREKRFREDLFYRLKVLELRVPSLAERPEDLSALASHFCRESCARHGFPPKRLSPGAIRVIATREWPGNVRELAHRVETAVLEAQLRGAALVEARDLDPKASGDGERARTLQESMRAFQRSLLEDTLEEVDWNVREAARRLDVTRSHVYNLIRAFELSRRG